MGNKVHCDKCPAKQNERIDCVCDGFHTFDELYEHRIVLFITLCNMIQASPGDEGFDCWKSKLHDDGTMYDGWFIAGIEKDKGSQISYHLPIKYWDKLYTEELVRAPKWDGHTPDDVIERLLNL